MTAGKRLISGSIVSWAAIVVSIVIQLAVVPIYLANWDASRYGLWLAVLSFVTALQIFDSGHQQLVGNEFLKYGSSDPETLSKVFSAATPYAFGIGALQILIALGFVHFSGVNYVFEVGGTLSNQLLDDAATIVLLSVIVFGVFGSVGGILVRVMAAIDLYPRMVWWGVIYSVVTTSIPALVVWAGGDLLSAGIAWVTSIFIYDIIMLSDIFRHMKKNGLKLVYPDFVLGRKNLWRSQVLVLTKFLEMSRTTGVRLILAPLSGSANLAAFSTMRTGANIAYQGLGTITGPLLPELMRVLRERNQEKIDAAFSTVWIVLVAVMAPFVVILQWIIEPFFTIWTREQIQFNPLLFGVLSIGVLVFAIAQPAMAIVSGNNLLRPQLVISVISASVVVVGMFFMIPAIGILGAGFALLAAEVSAALLFLYAAYRWLQLQGLRWPIKLSLISGAAVFIAVLGIGGTIAFPTYRSLIVPVAMILFVVNAILYWRSMPLFGRIKAGAVFGSIFSRF